MAKDVAGAGATDQAAPHRLVSGVLRQPCAHRPLALPPRGPYSWLPSLAAWARVRESTAANELVLISRGLSTGQQCQDAQLRLRRRRVGRPYRTCSMSSPVFLTGGRSHGHRLHRQDEALKPATITCGTTTIASDHEPEHQRYGQSGPKRRDALPLRWANYLMVGGRLVGIHVERSTHVAAPDRLSPTPVDWVPRRCLKRHRRSGAGPESLCAPRLSRRKIIRSCRSQPPAACHGCSGPVRPDQHLAENPAARVHQRCSVPARAVRALPRGLGSAVPLLLSQGARHRRLAGGPW